MFGYSVAETQTTNSASQPHTELSQLITNRPAPDLERLAERSAPDRRGDDATEAFHDILKLRDVGDAAAVPVLEKILAAHAGSTRIHGFAAAQALFCIGTPEAHAILSKHLLSSRYMATLGIDYAFQWEMDDAKRDRFIEQYHLKNLSDDLTLELSSDTHQDTDTMQIKFSLTCRNKSDKSFRIKDTIVFCGRMLYFRSDDGRFIQPVVDESWRYDLPPDEWLELTPGASHRFDIPVEVTHGEVLKARTYDVIYGLGASGRFTVVAMIEILPLSKSQREYLTFDNPWIGRAVSKPLDIEIGKRK